jgi:MFS family permease
LTAALVVAVVLVGSETLAVATVMPAVADDLGLGGYGLAFSLFSVGSVVGVLLAGPASDRRGPLVPFVLGMGLFALGLVVGTAAPSMPVLVAGRALQGLGAGAIPAVSYACIGRAYPEASRPRMLAVLSTAWVLPGLVGPGLAGLVAAGAGWRWVFGGLVPLVVLATVAAVRPLGRLSDPATGRAPGSAPAPPLPVLDAVRFAVGVGLLVAAVGRVRPTDPWAMLVALAFAAAGVVCAAGPSRRLLPAGWWSARPGIAAVVVARALVAYAFIAADAFVPLLLTDVRGRSLTFASLAVSLAALVWSVGSWLAERLVVRVGPSRLAAIGAAVVAVGVLWQVTLAVTAVPVVVALGGVALAAGGMGIAFTPLAMLVLDHPADAGAGVASSWMSLFEQLGFACGPLLGGALVAASSDPSALGRNLAASFVVAAGAAVIVVLLGGRLSPRVRAPGG